MCPTTIPDDMSHGTDRRPKVSWPPRVAGLPNETTSFRGFKLEGSEASDNHQNGCLAVCTPGSEAVGVGDQEHLPGPERRGMARRRSRSLPCASSEPNPSA